jgi:hypothetical protein
MMHNTPEQYFNARAGTPVLPCPASRLESTIHDIRALTDRVQDSATRIEMLADRVLGCADTKNLHDVPPADGRIEREPPLLEAIDRRIAVVRMYAERIDLALQRLETL